MHTVTTVLRSVGDACLKHVALNFNSAYTPTWAEVDEFYKHVYDRITILIFHTGRSCPLYALRIKQCSQCRLRPTNIVTKSSQSYYFVCSGPPPQSLWVIGSVVTLSLSWPCRRPLLQDKELCGSVCKLVKLTDSPRVTLPHITLARFNVYKFQGS
jgi:hypothetical protein